MRFVKKLSQWMDQLDKFDLEKKKMRREDRLAEVNYQAVQQKDETERDKQLENSAEKKTIVVLNGSENNL